MTQALTSPVVTSSVGSDLIGSSDVSRSRSRLRFLTDPSSNMLTYIGIATGIAGFIFLVVGWSEVAGTIDFPRQLPYIMSAGLPGLALVMVGLVTINISIRRQDAADRGRQMSALTEALRELQQSLEQ